MSTPPTPHNVQTVVLQREDQCHYGTFAWVGRDAYEALKTQRHEILHPNELQYYEPLPAESRRLSFLLGRYAAKLALQPHLEPPSMSAIDIIPGVFKQPVVSYPMRTPWQVSITHIDTLACAIAFPMVHPLGLDLERISPSRTSVMAGQCQESELREVRQTGLGEHAAATVLWTAKEAISKALGAGMMCSFDLLEVHSVERIQPEQFQGHYRALAHYKFNTWILDDLTLTIAMPKKTALLFEMKNPLSQEPRHKPSSSPLHN